MRLWSCLLLASGNEMLGLPSESELVQTILDEEQWQPKRKSRFHLLSYKWDVDPTPERINPSSRLPLDRAPRESLVAQCDSLRELFSLKFKVNARNFAKRVAGSGFRAEAEDEFLPALDMPVAFNPGDGTRVISAADWHGDFDVACEALLHSGVMDSEGTWADQNSFFVQTGDIVDRGAESPIIYEMLFFLQKDAHAQCCNYKGCSCGLIFLLGNHEALNMVGNHNYLAPAEEAMFYRDPMTGPTGEEQILGTTWMWHPTSGYLGSQVMKNSRVVQKIGDVAYVHAGLTSEMMIASNRRTAKTLPRLGVLGPMFARLWGDVRAGRASSEEYFLLQIEVILKQSILLEASKARLHTDEAMLLSGAHSPIWTRTASLADDGDREACSGLSPALKLIGCSAVIVGHTITSNGTFEKRCGRQYLMDSGSSRAFGLPYTGTNMYNVIDIDSAPDGKRVKRWTLFERGRTKSPFQFRSRIIRERTLR